MTSLARAAMWLVVSTSTLVIPLLMVSLHLPRKEHFHLRAAAGVALLAAFQLLYVPDGPFSSIDALSEELLVRGVLFFSANLVLMVLLVLFCHRTTLAVAAFCGVVSYTVENLAAAIGNVAGLLLPSPGDGLSAFAFMSLRMLVAAALVYTAFERAFVRNIRRHGMDIEPSNGIYLFVIAVILFNVMFDIASKRFLNLGLPLGYVFLSRAAVIAMCLYTLLLEYEMLFNRHMQAEVAANERILQDWKTQYELSQQTIDAINLKCHDIRHLADGSGGQTVDRAILDDIAREVNVYDSAVQTGNDALDTIITEKALLGEREGITMSCIADGEALSFMSPVDIYSFFGNALENAIEAVRQVEDSDRRNVSVLVRRVAGMASIHVENYFAGEVSFAAGTPASTKGDDQNHGFGFRSMRLVVEKYGGTLTADTDGQTFFLDALIPMS